MGLVDGSYPKDKFSGLEGIWKRVNVVVLSWLMNSVEKGLLGSIMYATCAKNVWEDLYERFNKIDG
ncbi:hypothetical protein KY284_020934 [Solanum tuberosum]|nr:hypothetical protein KY284_020934 [Solanum tuberosum]